MEGASNSEQQQQKKKLHVLVMPFPTQGHINPFLHFALNLGLHGAKVTFAIPHSYKVNMENAREEAGLPPPHLLGLDLHFVEVPDSVPRNFSLVSMSSTEDNGFQETLQKVACNRGLIEETILCSRNGPEPISCVISDLFLDFWTQDMANKLGIKKILICPSGVTTLAMTLLSTKDKLSIQGGAPRERDFIPTLDLLAKNGILGPNGFPLETRFEESYCMVVNSFEALESYVAENDLSIGTKEVRFLGPMLPRLFFGIPMTRIEASIIGASTQKDEADCIKWLDTCYPSSVLYISFGSYCVPSPDQLKEIARGIEMSKQPFLWVLRPPFNQYLSHEFLKQTHGFGLVVVWAPQLQVLRHESIGGYLTHCGWNSTLESICAGVPMLCLPLYADQPINALLITKHWKIGLALEKTKVSEDKGDNVMMVTKEEVERKVRALLRRGGDEQNDIVSIRENARGLKEAARKAVFGSTNDGICKLIADLQEVVFEAQS